MGYSNFKDPLGLLKRMLLSRNQVAYSVLFRELLGKFLVPIDYFLKGSEKRKLKNSTNSSEPIILILGGSRSGTTLLYQTLAQYLPVSYISNFIASFDRSPISAFKLFHKIIPKTKNDFKSYFGSVKGLDGPNDAFGLWNRWLGEDRNHIHENISEDSKADMKAFFNAWLQTTKKPFLNKNNRNSLCAPMFASIFPNVYFVEIFRDPIYVAQSLVLSRRTVQGSDKIGWGLLSTDSENKTDPLAYIDDICLQVHKTNALINKNRAKIDPKKYFRVSYEEFCENPGAFVQIVGLEALNYKESKKGLAELHFSTASNGQRLSDVEFNRIKSCYQKLHAKDEQKNLIEN
jgi:hypothetical protein